MALPVSRDATFVPGVSMVLSAVLNNVQDKIIDLDGGKHVAVRTIFIHPSAGGGSSGFSLGGGGIFDIGASALEWTIPVILPVGSRITQVDYYVNGDASKTVTAQLKYVDTTTGAVTALGSAQTSATANTYQTLTQSALNHTVATNRAYHIDIDTNAVAAADQIAFIGVKVTYDRP
jgi:hypothetical protein